MTWYLGRDGRIYDHDPGEGICLEDLSLSGQSRPQAPQSRPQAPQSRPQASQPRPQASQPRPQASQPRPQAPQSRPQAPQSRPQAPQSRPQASQPRPQAPQPARPSPCRTRPRAALPVRTVSWQRKFWYWFLTLGGAALLSAGVYFMFLDTLFSTGEAENLTGLLRNLISTIAPFVLVAGGVIPTLCYGTSAADLNNYNLHAYLWAGITCIFSLTATVFLMIVLPPVAAVVIPVVIVWNILKFIWELLTG